MALSIAGSHAQIPQEIIVDTDALATLVGNVTGTSGKFYYVDINNARTSASFTKFYDAATATVGTTPPDYVFEVPAGARRIFSFPDGIAFTNLSYACVTTPGTGGTTPPSGGSAVTIRIVTV